MNIKTYGSLLKISAPFPNSSTRLRLVAWYSLQKKNKIILFTKNGEKGDKKGKSDAYRASFSFLILACSSSSAICWVLVRKVSFDCWSFSMSKGNWLGSLSAFAIALKRKINQKIRIFTSRKREIKCSSNRKVGTFLTISSCTAQKWLRWNRKFLWNF